MFNDDTARQGQEKDNRLLNNQEQNLHRVVPDTVHKHSSVSILERFQTGFFSLIRLTIIH